MAISGDVVLLPDAGPLITLAYADELDLLLAPGWHVRIVDMVLHEVTRNQTPTSKRIANWIKQCQLSVLSTRIFQHYEQALTANVATPKKANLGELAAQEVMNDSILSEPLQTHVFLLEDHKIARASFLLPDNCLKVSTRAFLLFLEQHGWLDSAAEVERKAIQAGRQFSRLRFPPANGE